MHEHMAYIVLSLYRPFSFKDFLYFKLGDKEYRLSHGTFRNKILLLKKKQRSHGILIPAWNRENTNVKSFIHKTDTVSVILGCSLQPIPLDFDGIIRFFTLLAIVEEKLQSILETSVPVVHRIEVNPIPH